MTYRMHSPAVASPAPTTESPTDARSARPRVAVIGTILIFSALSLVSAVTSKGFLEADGCTHYLFARFSFHEPAYFVDVWGRPLCTGVYSFGAHFAGLIGVRVTSLLLALATALFTWRIARNQGYRWPALALMFTLGQPLFFLHSFSELTEMPFAALVAAAFWAYQTRRWLLFAFLVGITPLGRPEGFGFLLLAAAALVLHRRWPALLLLPVPVLLWEYAGWVLYGREPYPEGLGLFGLHVHLPTTLQWLAWLPHHWPYAATSLYSRGHPLHFVALLPAVVSPLVFPFMWIGMWRSLRRPAETNGAHLQRCQIVIACIPALVLLAHSVLYFLGKMASNGELRYMLVATPFWALLSAKGWEWAFTRFEWKRPFLVAGIAIALPVLTNCYYGVIPLRQADDWNHAEQVAAWYRSLPQFSPLRKDYPYVMLSHPGLFYYLDLSKNDLDRCRVWHKSTIRQPPPGTLVIWDPVYGVFNSDANLSITLDDLRANGWVQASASPAATDSPNSPWPDEAFEWQLFLSPKTVAGKPTAILP